MLAAPAELCCPERTPLKELTVFPKISQLDLRGPLRDGRSEKEKRCERNGGGRKESGRKNIREWMRGTGQEWMGGEKENLTLLTRYSFVSLRALVKWVNIFDESRGSVLSVNKGQGAKYRCV